MKSFITSILIVFITSSLCAQNWKNINPSPYPVIPKSVYIHEDGTGIIAGVGGYLFKTDNYGLNIDYFKTGVSIDKIWGLNKETLFGVNSAGQVLKTIDGGKNWSSQFLEFFEYDSPIELEFIDENKGIILAKLDNNSSKLFITSDSGDSWQETHVFLDENKPLRLLKMFHNNDLYITSNKPGKIYKSKNGGQSWTELDFDIDNLITGIHFNDNLNGHLYTYSTPLKASKYMTNNGGQSWVLEDEEFLSFIQTKFFGVEKGFANTIINRMYFTEDGGESWQRLYNTPGLVNDINFINEEIIIMVNNGLKTSFDFGETWNTFNSTVITREDLQSISYMNENVVYVGGWNGTLLKSNDGGKNFEVIETGYSSVFYDILTFDNSKIIIAGGNELIRSDDNGQTWYSQDVELPYTSSITKIGNTIWILGGNKILKSFDNGQSWDLIEIQEDVGIPLSMKFANEQNGFMFSRNPNGFGTLRFRTFDGGLSWEPWIEEDSYIYEVCFINSTEGFALGQSFFKTVDSGVTWTKVADFPNSYHGETLFFLNENIGFIAGKEGKIYKTTNGGLDWYKEETYTLFRDYFNKIVFSPTGNGLAVGLYGTILYNENGNLISSNFDLNPKLATVQIFPNPTSQEINLVSENINDKSILQIFNTNGNLISEIKGNQSNYPIDVRSLPAGTYFILHSNGELREKGIFVKQ